MTKRTILIRNTAATLISGLFLVPAAHATGIEIRDNQDFSVHMVPASEAAAPGAKAKKQAAPAPVQKMRITASGVVPESADDSAVAANPAPADKKSAGNTTRPAPATAAGTDAAKTASTDARHGSSQSAKAAPAETPVTIVPVKELASTAPDKQSDAKALSKSSTKLVQKDTSRHTAAAKQPGKPPAEKTTAQIKRAETATAPVAAEPATQAIDGKPQLADGLAMRITENGIIPESEYKLQLPQEDFSLAERDATKKDPASEDIATKARKALSGTSKSYTVKGIRYKPMSIDETTDFSQEGIASWYGPGFHGRRTANGEVYNQNAMTAAHKRLPISSYVRVTRVSTGKSIVVRINDRGPFVGNRVIDLSYGAAKRLGIVGRGSDKVKIEPISKEAAAGERNSETQTKAKKML